MIFNVIDSSNARLCRGQHEQDGVELPHKLTSQSRVEIPFAFAVADNTILHQLRGVLTYMTQVIHTRFYFASMISGNTFFFVLICSFENVKGENGSVSEKLDFKLQIPSSVFLSSEPISGDQFAELLASQELLSKDKAVCEGIALSQVLNIKLRFVSFIPRFS